MKALILENRVVDIVETEFEVAPTFTFMNAPDGCVAGEWILDENGDLVAELPDFPYTAEEKLRQRRTGLLIETDHLALSDQTLSAGMKTYRQELRDLPANSTPELDANGTLTGVTWPTKP